VGYFVRERELLDKYKKNLNYGGLFVDFDLENRVSLLTWEKMRVRIIA
jgi:hypothetical protein